MKAEGTAAFHVLVRKAVVLVSADAVEKVGLEDVVKS